MANGTRDPRSAAASGASTVTWTALAGWSISKLAPDLPPLDVTTIVGGVILLVHAAGTMARDYEHEQREGEPPRTPSFLIRQMAKYMG
jgi:hypothetical protein